MIVNLLITPQNYHHTTLRNAELIHLMEGILFPLNVGASENSQLCCVAT